MNVDHSARLCLGPQNLYREVVEGREGPLSAWIEEAFVVLARPGETPISEPRSGDLLVRVGIGEPSLGHVALLSNSILRPREGFRAATSSERGGTGQYATVVEGGAFPHERADGFARRVLDSAGHVPSGQILLRPRPSRVSDHADREFDQDFELPGFDGASDEGSPGEIRPMIQKGWSENEITNSLFFDRNPTLPKEPLQPGTKLARVWQSIRDSEVRPALKSSLRRRMVDPALLASFLSQYEDDEWVPPRAKELFLTEPPLISMGKTLRDRLLWNWKGGRSPVSLGRFYRLAFDLCGHVGTAALLCHNVAKAFARGGTAISWKGSENEGEYTDGRKTYTSKVVHPAGTLRWFNKDKGREVVSIFYLVFSAQELGTDDPGDWYHFFVAATMAAYGASGELTENGEPTPEGEQGSEEDDRDKVLVRVARPLYLPLVKDRLLDLQRQMSNPSLRGVHAFRGWILANALSFLEGGYYGEKQEDVARESRVHLRGAMFGLQQVASAPGKNWPWYVPGANSISRDELASGFQLISKTAEVLDPSGQTFSADGSDEGPGGHP